MNDPGAHASLPASSPDRSPPHSAEAEEHVIACCLLDGSDPAPTLQRAVDAGLKPASFYFPANRLIYEILLEMWDGKATISLETLAEELKTRRQLEAVGGFAYLMQVTGKIPTTAHAGYFIEKVREKHLLRELIRAAAGAVEKAYGFTGSAAELKAFAESIRSQILPATQHGKAEMLEKLESRRLRASAPPPEPVTRLFLAGKPIATPGNLAALIAKSKSGKTACAGGIIAAPVAAAMGKSDVDTLGFTASKPEGKALVLIDTEQSMYDAYMCFMRALRRAETDQDLPWLHAYGLAGWSAPDLRATLRPVLDRAVKVNGGIFAVVLDGVADFVTDVNSPEESNAFVAELHGLAIEYDCSIICVIHSNEARMAGDDGRGHLGKQLTRKAESNLLLKKVGDITTVTSEKQRKAPITEADGVAFKWSDEEGRHVSCAAPGNARDIQKAEGLRELANEVFGADRQLRRAELERRIGDARDIKGNTRGRRVDEMKRLGVVQTVGFGLYERVA